MPRVYKHRLLLDEGLPYKIRLPRTNSRYNLKHLKENLKQSGLSDDKVYKLAVKMQRLLVVFNIKHFRDLATKSKNSGIIGISQNLSPEQIDKKLTALLVKSKPRDLYGKFTSISGETK